MECERKVENFEDFVKTKSDEIKNTNHSNGGQSLHQNGKENANPNKENKTNNVRRHDEPSELSFEICMKSKSFLLLFIFNR
jgi:hypothetical protein